MILLFFLDQIQIHSHSQRDLRQELLLAPLFSTTPQKQQVRLREPTLLLQEYALTPLMVAHNQVGGCSYILEHKITPKTNNSLRGGQSNKKN